MKTQKIIVDSNSDEIEIEFGVQAIILDKLFGPTAFANLRIHADVQRNAWIIEREVQGPNGNLTWLEWCLIPGQLENKGLSIFI